MGTLTMRNRRAGLSDAALIDRARSGDLEAYGKLFERHRESARALARQLSPSAIEADEAVSEAFERVLGAIRRGNGPKDSFRPYLLTAIRRTTYDRTRRESRATATSEEWLLDTGVEDVDPSLLAFERGALAEAYRSLPERWQSVLWHTEIEETPPEELAEMLGVKPNALAALAYRAREGLRQAYVLAHVDIDLTSNDPVCRWTVDNLPRYLRSKLNDELAQQVDTHLDECLDCRSAYAEMAEVGLSLRAVFAPLLVSTAALGGAGVAGAGAGAGAVGAGAVSLAGWGAGSAGAGAAGAGAGATAGVAGVSAASATAGVAASATVTAGTTTMVAGVAAATVAATVGGALVLPHTAGPPADQSMAPAVAAPTQGWVDTTPDAPVVIDGSDGSAAPAGLAMVDPDSGDAPGTPAGAMSDADDAESVVIVPESEPEGEISFVVIERTPVDEEGDDPGPTAGSTAPGLGQEDVELPDEIPAPGSLDRTPDDEEPIGDIGEPLVITPPIPDGDATPKPTDPDPRPEPDVEEPTDSEDPDGVETPTAEVPVEGAPAEETPLDEAPADDGLAEADVDDEPTDGQPTDDEITEESAEVGHDLGGEELEGS